MFDVFLNTYQHNAGINIHKIDGLFEKILDGEQLAKINLDPNIEHGHAEFNFDGGWSFKGFMIAKKAEGYGRLERNTEQGTQEVYDGIWKNSVLSIQHYGEGTNEPTYSQRKFAIAKESDFKQINKTILIEMCGDTNFPEINSHENTYKLKPCVIYTTLLRRRIYKCNKAYIKIDQE
jgi:hypothetical protein